MKPELFIGSSVEGLNIVEAVEQDLQHRFNVTAWKSGVFNVGKIALNDLLSQLDKSDFGIFIFSADDITQIRGTEYSTVRDNVLYELGLYTGRLGLNNVFILKPSNSKYDFHLPSDLSGINVGVYDTSRNFAAAISPFCGNLKSQIFNNNKYPLNGKWKFTWQVKNSNSYPSIIEEEVEIFHYDNKLKFIHSIGDKERYMVSGTLINLIFTGFWQDVDQVGYNGVFQMKLNGNKNKFHGIWVGWSNNGNVNSGPCFLERVHNT